MEGFGRRIWLLGHVLTSVFLGAATANTLLVGGRGWAPPLPSQESYSHWAERHRFQIGDTIVFTYDPNVDSVVRVATKAEYDACNASHALRTFKDGNTHVKFESHGSAFFISGNVTRCSAGEKIWILVLAPRNKTAPSSPSPSPASAPASPPLSSPLSAPGAPPSGGGAAGVVSSPPVSGGGRANSSHSGVASASVVRVGSAAGYFISTAAAALLPLLLRL